MSDPFFFGYGSLVNRATHAYTDAHRARLTGWGRAWVTVDSRHPATLTGIRAEGRTIEGLIAGVPGNDWAALDTREAGYGRHHVTETVAHPVDRPLAVQVYAVPRASFLAVEAPAPILLSYLDVVVQGYLREFGEDGVHRFFGTTEGWDRPVRDDRAAPLYPRHQTLTPDERALVTDLLGETGTVIVR
ncbi:gamma-glutamylcyclotransferase family protein [Anianabacter salinae]|uniref:gamma-glutamylcyclotransferase family protein n=1 Tax=Anianabacter salinae TaxID=2851023 RepID=UPI00225E0CF6|nr:gamma-glutamylcyclotransferase family protein [Anianabacter salinae]MBV0910994.1 gamma-glutamylcyclotransferase [Anianabacter salinae]